MWKQNNTWNIRRFVLASQRTRVLYWRLKNFLWPTLNCNLPCSQCCAMTRFFRENSAKLQTVSHLSIFHLMQQSSNRWDFFFAFQFFTNCFYKHFVHWRKKIEKKLCLSKAELLHLNLTRFPSLGIFVSKKVGNRKN